MKKKPPRYRPEKPDTTLRVTQKQVLDRAEQMLVERRMRESPTNELAWEPVKFLFRVADFLTVPYQVLIGRRRKNTARALAVAALKKIHPELSLSAIGRIVGIKHPAVAYAIKHVDAARLRTFLARERELQRRAEALILSRLGTPQQHQTALDQSIAEVWRLAFPDKSKLH